MANFLKKISIVLGIFGIIGTLIFAKISGSRMSYIFDWEAALLVFLCGTLGVAFISIFIYWMGEIVEHLNNISKYVKDLSLDTKQSIKSSYNKENSWVCRTCGRHNFMYNTTCTCGSRKEDNV